MKTCSAVILSAMLAGSPAFAADRNEVVRITLGKTTENIYGSVHGHDAITYDVTTAEGLKLRLLFTPSSRLCYFNVYEPGKEAGKDVATFVGSTSGIEFRVSPTMAGTYKARVYVMRNSARHKEDCHYQLSVKLSGSKKQ